MPEHVAGEVVDLTRYRETFAPSGVRSGDISATVAGNDYVPSSTGHVTLDDLYGDANQGSNIVQTARRLLLDCQRHIDNAIASGDGGDRVEGDLEASRAFAVWPELFLCRSISDGFGAAVLGIHYAYFNLQGDLFSSNQLNLLAESIEYLTDNPFLTFDMALGLLEKLEDAGLKVDPPEASALAEILDAEQ